MTFDSFTSVRTTQERACRRYAAENGYTVGDADVYREVFTGVELLARPKLTAVRDLIRKREVDAVIAYAIDRLAHDPVHLGVLISEAEHAGVEELFVTEPLDYSPEGQLIRFVRGYAAKVEHEKIRERSIRGRQERVRQGKLLPARNPRYGYRWADGNGTYLEDAGTAPIVRRIFRECLAGKSTWAMAVGLQAEGIPTPLCGAWGWRNATVLRILTSRQYTGEAVAWQWKCDKTRGGRRVVQRPTEEWVGAPRLDHSAARVGRGVRRCPGAAPE